MLSGKQMEEAMGMLIIRHKVKDYGKWRPNVRQALPNAESSGP
jgi:hypothetical protein